MYLFLVYKKQWWTDRTFTSLGQELPAFPQILSPWRAQEERPFDSCSYFERSFECVCDLAYGVRSISPCFVFLFLNSIQIYHSSGLIMIKTLSENIYLKCSIFKTFFCCERIVYISTGSIRIRLNIYYIFKLLRVLIIHGYIYFELILLHFTYICLTPIPIPIRSSQHDSNTLCYHWIPFIIWNSIKIFFRSNHWNLNETKKIISKAQSY